MRAIGLLLCTASLSLGYIQNTGGGGTLHRTDNASIQMLLNSGAVGGLTNSKNAAWISAGSNVARAVSAALSIWNSTPAAIHFAPLKSTTLQDGTPCSGTGAACNNVIAFDDTPENREAIGGAIAITVNSFLEDGSGKILKSDIIFNPTLEFSTNLAAGTYDIQSIVTHEIGHTLGSSHSGVLSATMFWATQTQQTDYSRPQPDDLAFVNAVYPSGGNYGTVTGKVQDSNGKFLRGALISLQDPNTGIIIGGISSITDGTFSILAPPGNYQIWAEPLGGQIQPANVYLTPNQVDQDFQPVVAGAEVNVTGGGSSPVTLKAPAGASPIQISQTGSAPLGANNLFINPGYTDLVSGQTLNLFIDAKGLDAGFSAGDISFVGAGITVQPGTFKALQALSDGELYLLTVTVPAVATRTAATLFINHNGNTAVLSGGLVILPPTPSFPSNGIGNVFSYQSNAVAPGEIVAIFGTNMGPAGGAGGGFDLSGSLATYAGGVQVTFDGQPAPIFYAGAGQINVEVPFEVAGQSSTNIVVNTGTASAAVSIPVDNTLIGLFPAAANFPSYQLNSVGNPIAAGDYIILYAVGLGVLQTPVATGAEVLGVDASTAAVTVSFGGQTVTPYYAGAAPLFTGLGQITVQVPPGYASGPVQVSASSGGQTSMPITVFVQ